MSFESHKLYLIKKRFDSVSEIMKVKDGFTHEHCHRTAVVSCALSEFMGDASIDLPEELRYCAYYLHDCGKLTIPNEILHSRDVLDPDHIFRQIIKKHPKAGEELLVDLPEIVRFIALYHQEWFNGRGYPEGISGDDILLPVAICTVSDVFDAAISKRRYKLRKSFIEVIKEIRQEREEGHFSPSVVDAFLKMVYRPEVEKFLSDFYDKSLDFSYNHHKYRQSLV